MDGRGVTCGCEPALPVEEVSGCARGVEVVTTKVKARNTGEAGGRQERRRPGAGVNFVQRAQSGLRHALPGKATRCGHAARVDHP